MRSVPLIRLLTMTAALAFAAIAVWNVTHPEATASTTSAMEIAPTTVPAKRSVQLELTFSQSPVEYELLADGITLLKGTATTAVVHAKLPESLSAGGADWIVRARWKDKSTPSAVRVFCRDAVSGQALMDSTLWGQGSVEDVVTLH